MILDHSPAMISDHPSLVDKEDPQPIKINDTHKSKTKQGTSPESPNQDPQIEQGKKIIRFYLSFFNYRLLFIMKLS